MTRDMKLRTLIGLALLWVILLLSAGCRQDEGKPCQTTSDCDKGLVCCFNSAAAASSLGVCTEGTTCSPLPDAEVTSDAST